MAVPVPKLAPVRDVRAITADERSRWLTWNGQECTATDDRVELPVDFYLREFFDLPLWHMSGTAWLDRCAELMCTYGQLLPPGEEYEPGWVHRDYVDGVAKQVRVDGFSYQTYDLLDRLREAHSAVLTWLAVQTGWFDLLDEWIDRELADPGHRDVLVGTDPSDRNALRLRWAEEFLAKPLNLALRPFSIGVGSYEERSPSIYTAVFLQIYNHMVEDAKIKRCAKAGCERWFVRQRGRSRFDQHRTEGVKYCSRECAQAQSQRDLRRRRKVAGTA